MESPEAVGSKCLGHRLFKSRSLHQVRRLDPPSPWMKSISTDRSGGAYSTLRPRGSSLRSSDCVAIESSDTLVPSLPYHELLPLGVLIGLVWG